MLLNGIGRKKEICNQSSLKSCRRSKNIRLLCGVVLRPYVGFILVCYSEECIIVCSRIIHSSTLSMSGISVLINTRRFLAKIERRPIDMLPLLKIRLSDVPLKRPNRTVGVFDFGRWVELRLEPTRARLLYKQVKQSKEGRSCLT
jgi:hypothetical protein